MNSEEITNPKLTLRIIRATDVDKEYVNWLNNPLVNRFLEVRHREVDIDSQRVYVDKIFNSTDTYLFGIYRDCSSMIGTIKIGPIDFLRKFGEVGILIGEPESWGKGFATEAIGMLCENFFEKRILRKITAGVMEANLGSRRAFEKNEFVIEGILKDHCIGSDGRYSNVIRYGKILHFNQGNDVK
jgi:RimJ/RimL family protein N-acetyltransferase